MSNEFKLNKKEFDRTTKRILKEIPQAIDRILIKIATIALNNVKRLTPVDTGTLRRMWRISKPQNGKITIFNITNYGYFVEKGRRTKKGGFVTGRFMLTRTMKNIEKKAISIIEQEIQKIIK